MTGYGVKHSRAHANNRQPNNNEIDGRNVTHQEKTHSHGHIIITGKPPVLPGDGYFFASLLLYGMCGLVWYYQGSLKQFISDAREFTKVKGVK